MALDIITQRSSNNIFGQDLWGLSMSGEGLYGGVMSTEHLYTAGTRAGLKDVAELYGIKDPKHLAAMPAAWELWKKEHPFLFDQNGIFTDTWTANG